MGTSGSELCKVLRKTTQVCSIVCNGSTQAWVPVLSWISGSVQELRQLKLPKSYSREICFEETSEAWQGEVLDLCGLTCSKVMMVPQNHNQA